MTNSKPRKLLSLTRKSIQSIRGGCGGISDSRTAEFLNMTTTLITNCASIISLMRFKKDVCIMRMGFNHMQAARPTI